MFPQLSFFIGSIPALTAFSTEAAMVGAKIAVTAWAICSVLSACSCEGGPAGRQGSIPSRFGAGPAVLAGCFYRVSCPFARWGYKEGLQAFC